jgi:hypothetical protein
VTAVNTHKIKLKKPRNKKNLTPEGFESIFKSSFFGNEKKIGEIAHNRPKITVPRGNKKNYVGGF